MKIKILPDKWKENVWGRQMADTAFWDLQQAAFRLFCAIEDIQSCNLDKESDGWFDDLKEKLSEIDNAMVEYGEELYDLVIIEP